MRNIGGVDLLLVDKRRKLTSFIYIFKKAVFWQCGFWHKCEMRHSPAYPIRSFFFFPVQGQLLLHRSSAILTDVTIIS